MLDSINNYLHKNGIYAQNITKERVGDRIFWNITLEGDLYDNVYQILLEYKDYVCMTENIIIHL